MSHTDSQNSRIEGARFLSGNLGKTRRILAGNVALTANGPFLLFLDPNGSTRTITLPSFDDNGQFRIISNIGTSGSLIVQDTNLLSIATIGFRQTVLFIGDASVWTALGTIFGSAGTGHAPGLVPDADVNVNDPPKFLGDDGAWHSFAASVTVNAFQVMVDGTFSAVANGYDTFRFRSTDGSVRSLITNNDPTFGDNISLSVSPENVDHNLLLNYSANRHIDHTGVSFSTTDGLQGGGDISLSRTLRLDFNGLVSDIPVASDVVGFWDVSASLHKKVAFGATLFSAIDHNLLLNYTAGQHVNHAGVSIIAGTGLDGGGTIEASRTLNLNYSLLATATSMTASDRISISNAGTIKQISFSNLNAAIDHNGLTNFVANQHIDHTTVTLTATNGITGGGDISASRSFGLATISNQRLFSNISGGTAVPSANTLTTVLDNIIGSTRGQIALRGSSSWGSLSLGTTNQLLQSNGIDLRYTTVSSAGTGDVVGPSSSTDNAIARFDGTTGKLVQNSSATLSDAGVLVSVGTQTTDNAGLGMVGEYQSSDIVAGAAVSLTDITVANVTLLNLTAGDWDVVGVVCFTGAGATTHTDHICAINSVSASLPTLEFRGSSRTSSATFTLTGDVVLNAPMRRFSLAASAPIYLVAYMDFAVSTGDAYGQIRARRAR